MSSIISSRIADTAEILGVSKSILVEFLQNLGIPENEMGERFLSASTTTEQFLVEQLKSSKTNQKISSLPEVRIMAAASALKGKNPFGTSSEIEKPKETNLADAVISAIKDQRDLKQYRDEELLQYWENSRDFDAEQELHRRSGYRRFIVIDSGIYDPGKEKINFEASLKLLKKARKGEEQKSIPLGDAIVPVYKITDLNIAERIVELCPMCGNTLYEGYCEHDQIIIKEISQDVRAFIKLLVESKAINTDNFSDRKKVVEVAKEEGIVGLKKLWPIVGVKFDELKLTDNLPKLKVIKSTPSKMSDPFRVK